MRVETSYRGRLRDVVIVLAFVLTLLQPVSLTQMIVAAGVLGVGVALHVLTKATLIRNKVLCVSGVYEISRHPYYLSNFMIDMSFCLLSGNIYLVMFYPFLFFWAYGAALKSEETALAKTHGQEYLHFSLRTPQVFPSPGSFRRTLNLLKPASLSRISRNEWVRISRYWATAFLLMLANEIRFEGIVVFRNPVDMDAVAMGVACVVAAAATIALQISGKRGPSTS